MTLWPGVHTRAAHAPPGVRSVCGPRDCSQGRVSFRRAPRAVPVHDTFCSHREAGLVFCRRAQPRALCVSTDAKRISEPEAFFNRSAELGKLKGLLGATPTGVLLLTGPPSCGKSGACYG